MCHNKIDTQNLETLFGHTYSKITDQTMWCQKFKLPLNSNLGNEIMHNHFKLWVVNYKPFNPSLTK